MKKYRYELKLIEPKTKELKSIFIESDSYNDCFEQIFKIEKEFCLESLDLKLIGEAK